MSNSLQPDTEVFLEAAESADIETVRQQLALGVDIHADHGEGTALSWAVGREREDLIRILIDHGADINRRNNSAHKARPAHVAVASYNIKILKLVVELGADLSLTDGKGLTPLQMAEQWEWKEAVRLLRPKRWWRFW